MRHRGEAWPSAASRLGCSNQANEARLSSGLDRCPQENTSARFVVEAVDSCAFFAKPEVLHGMRVRGMAIEGLLMKTVKASLSVVELRRTFRICAFEKHLRLSPACSLVEVRGWMGGAHCLDHNPVPGEGQ